MSSIRLDCRGCLNCDIKDKCKHNILKEVSGIVDKIKKYKRYNIYDDNGNRVEIGITLKTLDEIKKDLKLKLKQLEKKDVNST